MIKYIWEVIFIYSNELVCNILKYINININTEITIINLSNIFSYDKTYIMKKFKRELGLTIIEYINNKRILNSLNGYNSIEYYSEIFRNLVGVSPRVYKRFITPLNNLNEEETNTIRNSISNLINIENKIQKYLSNQKPKELPVRKLSIFK